MSENTKILEDIWAYYGGLKERSEQETIVSMLRELQDVCGFLPPYIQEKSAEVCGVELSLIQLLMRMYPSLKQAPYEHEITVCSGARCGAKSGAEIIDAVQKQLRIGKDHISADGKWFLKVQNCLKHCKTSPNMMIDGTIYEHLDVEKAKKIIENI